MRNLAFGSTRRERTASNAPPKVRKTAQSYHRNTEISAANPDLMQVFRGFDLETQKIEQKLNNRHFCQHPATAAPAGWGKLTHFCSAA
ncbi:MULTISPECIES: hypothetical protein [Pseudomonas]|uniref:hypothetical protein n=1 Tax=Pseudomonas TaxID=286 RepID=UPI0018AA653F|nr:MULTISPECIES: hypothetical protein [Pseudomonas]MBF8745554.1 hypothetical protein [Pseudomonas monteilii]MCT8162985.1 hypothetical protein [Pseudomonas sp. HD6422]MCT8181679.1 hypothetical protein [Pseudomonas sp. HD6421]